MKKIYFLIAAIITAPIFISWGGFGHETINRAAIFALPASSLQNFFYNHSDFITVEATIPDVRKYALNDKKEGPRHFIDLENFDRTNFPKTLAEARKAYPDSFLNKNGILPWYVQEVMRKLTNAFKKKNKTEILFLAADLGHYIGDAHMPLHTTVNYNGQLTQQHGVHALWEAQMPEMFAKTYHFYADSGTYITNAYDEIMRILNQSHMLADTLLLKHKQTQARFKTGMFVLNENGDTLINQYKNAVHSKAFMHAFNNALDGMIQKQLKRAITATASFWYTAWVDAGRPDLTDLDPKETTKRNQKELKTELELFKKGKLTNYKPYRDFEEN